MQVALEPGATLPTVKNAMPQRSDTADHHTPRVSLPAYFLPVIVTLLLAFLGNMSFSIYWAGQVAANQAHMVDTLVELKAEVKQLREENQALQRQVVEIGVRERRREQARRD